MPKQCLICMNFYQLFAYLPLSLLQIVAGVIAYMIGFLPKASINRCIDINLRLAYPDLNDQERKRLHKRIICNHCLTGVESIKSWTMPPAWAIGQIHTVHNQAILTNALANPKGMIAIVPHLGTWEMMNAWLNQFGAPTIMYKPVRGKIRNDFVLQGRQRLNAKLVPTDASGVKAIFKTLKEGGFSIILPDHVPDKRGGVVVPFFNIPTLTGTLVPKLAYKTSCALVGLACIRRDDGQGFDIFCYDFDDPNLYDKDPIVASTALNAAMEQMIDEHKSHYIWSYRRFKHVPNIDNIYWLDSNDLQKIANSYH